MLTVILAGFSVAAGMLIAIVGSVALVIYFSAAAATIIAVLEIWLGGSFGTVAVAWFATIFAVQFGFALATMALAMAKSRGWNSTKPPARPEQQPAGPIDSGTLAQSRRASAGLPSNTTDRRRTADF